MWRGVTKFATLTALIAGICIPAWGLGIADSAMCAMLPPHQRVDEFQSGEGMAYAWTLLEDLDGQHAVSWTWITPAG